MFHDFFTAITGNAEPLLATIILILMLGGFVRDRYPVEVVALAGAASMLVFGLVDIKSFEIALSNTAPWIIAAMFVLSGALVRVGLISEISTLLKKHIQDRPILTLVTIIVFIIVLSAFMNNTPVVVIMMPLVLRVGKAINLKASKSLIPLSYLAILGGMLTLVGTSTNLLVNGVAVDLGLEPFSLFELTPFAFIIALVGLIYILAFSQKLLPDRTSMAETLIDRKRMSFFTEVAIPEDSPVIGRAVMSVELFKREGMRVIDVLRGDESLRRAFPHVLLEAGDRIVLRTGVNELLGLKESRALAMVDKLASRKTTTVETLISPTSMLVGRRLGSLRLRRRYGVYPLAVHRSSQNLGRQLDDIVIRSGDTLLLEGTAEDISRLSQELELVDLSETAERSYRREKAPWTLLIWVLMLALSGMNILPLFVAAVLAVAAVLLIRAIDIDEALEAVEGRLLLMIFSMLVVGEGLQNSGAIDHLVHFLLPAMQGLGPVMTIWIIFILTSSLTEILSNNAVGVIMTPVAVALATALGVEPRPFVVAVMIAASCAFATPIGYQTNTMVYGPGGYKFTDFVRFGLPLNLLIGVISSFLIPYFFPL